MAVHLLLFVADATPATQRMAAAVRRWCDTRLGGAYRLDILDMHLAPDEVKIHGILAAPALVLEGAACRLVGDFTNPDARLDHFFQAHTS